MADEGNLEARAVIHEVFEVCDWERRRMGTIPRSGWRLRERFHRFDAEACYGAIPTDVAESEACRSERLAFSTDAHVVSPLLFPEVGSPRPTPGW